MIDDPIVDTVRRHRERYAASFNYDVHAIATDRSPLVQGALLGRDGGIGCRFGTVVCRCSLNRCLDDALL